MISVIDNIPANESAIGPAYKTPFNPKAGGSIKSKGMRKSPCREIERIIPRLASPIDVK